MVEFGIINTNCWQESSPNINNKTFINTDIPLLMHIIESGWPNMYSVLIEDGIVGKPRLEFLTEEQIETKYNINIKQKKNMNQNLTELVCIIDRSTSIKTNGLIKSTIEGFNSLLEKQKNEPGMAKMTVVLFDGDRYNPQYAYDIIHDGVDINLVKELNEYDYVPRGMTALYDAIGKTIDTIKTRQMNTPNDERASKIIVAILTDGEENSSVEYNKETIKTMIEELEREHGWVFLFLGAGIDAMSAGVNIGISKSNTLSFNSTDFETKNTYLRLNTVISRTRGLSNAHYNASKSDLMSVIYETTDDDQ